MDGEAGAGPVLERANKFTAAFYVGVGWRLDHHGAALVGLLNIDERGVGTIKVFPSQLEQGMM